MNKFTIITPCKNSEKLISETIYSVLNQSVFKKNKAQLEYIIIDGKSNDHTIEIIKKIDHKNIFLVSENDNNMCDALVKGISRGSGNIFAYINAGDIYYEKAFEIVDTIMYQEKIKWITGCKITYNENSEITNIYTPYKYRRLLLQNGIYGRYLPFLQQESTFWKKELNSYLDLNFLKTIKYCGDNYIWSKFSEKNDVYVINTFLSGFKFHNNQLSSQKDKNKTFYELENKKIFKLKFIKKIKILLFVIIDSPFWFISKYLFTIFRLFNKNFIIYNKVSKKWD